MSEITQDAVDIVQKHVADRWLHFGRALLKTDNTGVRDITSKLSGSDPTAPRGIFEKLRRVLEAWVEKRGKNKSPPTRVQLQEACRAEGILGGAEMTYDSYCGKGAGDMWSGTVPYDTDDPLYKSIIENGANKWRGLGRRLLCIMGDQLNNEVGEVTVTNSQRVDEIIWSWVSDKGDKATLNELRNACKEVGVLGVVDQDLEELSMGHKPLKQ